jgi:hypothetical protein
VSLRLVPVTLEQANDFVLRYHRHSRPVVGQKFSVGVAYDDCGATFICGVAIVGRPISRLLDDGLTVEITRVCTYGTKNASSMLYGACRRAAKAMGYVRVLTYTLPQEGGASLRAAGFQLEKEDAGGTSKDWRRRHGTAPPVGDDLVGGKWRWVG